MTLSSSDSNKAARRAAARARRQEYDAELARRHPWLLPVLVAGAILIVAGVLAYWVLTEFVGL